MKKKISTRFPSEYIMVCYYIVLFVDHYVKVTFYSKASIVAYKYKYNICLLFWWGISIYTEWNCLWPECLKPKCLRLNFKRAL